MLWQQQKQLKDTEITEARHDIYDDLDVNQFQHGATQNIQHQRQRY